MNATQIYKQLLGNWQLTRTITHHHGETFYLIGRASFTSLSNHYHYREEGEISSEQLGSTNFSKDYYYALIDKTIQIFFDSQLQNHYQTINLSQPSASHLCVRDTYDTTYNFSALPHEFQTTCKVHGPNKNYTIHSLYRRILS